VKTDRDFLRGCLSFVGFFLLGGILFALTSCAAMAGLLGVETAADTTQKIKEVHAMLDPLGPWGSLAATATSAVLLAANHAYRNKTRKKALGK
jgi:hypothetical protein